MRQLELTADLVALVHRDVPDPGPDGRFRDLTDEEFDSFAAELLAEIGDGPIWLFAYGSLIWRPDFEHVESVRGRIHGWRRSFCLRDYRWRGSQEQPGFMLALDRGGSCNGVVYRLTGEDPYAQMLRLLYREAAYDGDFRSIGFLNVRTEDGRVVRALTFWLMPRDDPDYANLPIEDQAQMLARAVGFLGSTAEYLHNTISQLAALGIHDSYLWSLQRLVAQQIRADFSPDRVVQAITRMPG